MTYEANEEKCICEPTININRRTRIFRDGGGDSFLFIYFMFYLFWYSYIVYFVCDSASEFGAMDSTSFFGVFLP